MKKGDEVRMRERAVKQVTERGKSLKEVGEIFGVHFQRVRNGVECDKKTGKVVTGSVKVKRPYKLDRKKLRKDVEEHPAADLAARVKKFGVAMVTV